MYSFGFASIVAKWLVVFSTLFCLFRIAYISCLLQTCNIMWYGTFPLHLTPSSNISFNNTTTTTNVHTSFVSFSPALECSMFQYFIHNSFACFSSFNAHIISHTKSCFAIFVHFSFLPFARSHSLFQTFSLHENPNILSTYSLISTISCHWRGGHLY